MLQYYSHKIAFDRSTRSLGDRFQSPSDSGFVLSSFRALSSREIVLVDVLPLALARVQSAAVTRPHQCPVVSLRAAGSYCRLFTCCLGAPLSHVLLHVSMCFCPRFVVLVAVEAVAAEFVLARLA